MIQRSIVVEKFSNLDRCLKRIEAVVAGDPGRIEEQDVQDIFILHLQRAVQLCIDIAAHIISDAGLTMPVTLKEYFLVLAKEQQLPEELARKMGRMVGFRNIAVHDYQVLDPAILKSIYVDHLGDFRLFQKEILKLLQ